MRWVIRWRRTVFAATALLVLISLAFSTRLQVVIDPAAILPQSHPFVASRAILEGIFGDRYALVVSVRPVAGDALQPPVLEKIQRITEALARTPGVVKSTLISLTARKAKAMRGSEEGLEVRPFVERIPSSTAEIAALRERLRANPQYFGTLISEDFRTAGIVAQFEPDPAGYATILRRILPAIDRERDASVQIDLSGHLHFLGQIEMYSERMVFLVPLAILIIGLIHYEAFRSRQGMILPLVTAILALVFGLGFMGAMGIPLDVFNATTPILILAVAAGHAVQILKRYYEEYARLSQTLPPDEANTEAIVCALDRVGRFMLTAGGVAALGFLSLMIFEIKSVQTFGLFTGLGILSALALEFTFIPAMRSWLPPPRTRETKSSGWRRLTDWLATAKPRVVLAAWGMVVIVALLGAWQVQVENSNRANFAEFTAVRTQDAAINRHLAGTQMLYVMLDTGVSDGIKSPGVLQGLEALQKRLDALADVGKTLSMVDFLKRLNQAMNADDPTQYRLPGSAELVSQYLLLYSLSGEPGDFDSFVDYDYRRLNLKVFVKEDSSRFVEGLVNETRRLTRELLPTVQVSFGGGVAEAAALNEVIVRDKLLNILQISSVVWVVSSLVFGSLIAGLLVLSPLLIAVLVNFGLLGWFGIPLNIPTSLISAMAVGIGADYAIYFISRYREETRADNPETLRETMGSAGQACLYVATAVACGYGVLALSIGFKVHLWLALLIATAMLVSALAALTLIPALLQVLKPAFIDRRASL